MSRTTLRRTPGPKPAIDRNELLNEQLILHARVLIRMPAFQALLVAAMGWIVWPDVPNWQFAVWALAALAAEVLRASFAYVALRRLPVQVPQSIYRGFMALDALSGLAIGSAAVLFIPHVPILSQVLIETILFAVAAAGTAVVISTASMLAAYSLIVLACASGTWIVLHPSQRPVVLVLTLAYATFLALIARDGKQMLRHSVSVRHQRDQALHALEQSDAELRTAHGCIERATKARNQIMAAASHDMRQPLQALSVYNALLTAQPEPQIIGAVSRNIEKIVQELGQTLDELLDLSQLSAGSYRVQHRVIALDEIVDDVCAALAPAVRRKGIALSTDVCHLTFQSDGRAVGRIARNLIDNAIKYTTHGNVRVTGFAEGGAAVLSVEDTGCGIPEEQHARIFEEFYQVPEDREGPRVGVGLGLAIVQRLCDLTAACIHVDSAPGRGTRMTVRWPGVIDQSASVHISDTGAMADVVWSGTQRVYVLDDDPEVVRGFCTLLNAWGLSSKGAASSSELDALIAAEGIPEVLIADLDLGHGESGLDAALRVAGDCHLRAVILISADTVALAGLEGRVLTNIIALQKPVAPSTLRAELLRLLPG